MFPLHICHLWYVTKKLASLSFVLSWEFRVGRIRLNEAQRREIRSVDPRKVLLKSVKAKRGSRMNNDLLSLIRNFFSLPIDFLPRTMRCYLSANYKGKSEEWMTNLQNKGVHTKHSPCMTWTALHRVGARRGYLDWESQKFAVTPK